MMSYVQIKEIYAVSVRKKGVQMDVAHGELVEKWLTAFVEKRERQRRKDEGALQLLLGGEA